MNELRDFFGFSWWQYWHALLVARIAAMGWRPDSDATHRRPRLLEDCFLLLSVPSVLVPETWNVLVNPRHVQAGALRVVAVYEHGFGGRLL
jgi:hypothetical protein